MASAPASTLTLPPIQRPDRYQDLQDEFSAAADVEAAPSAPTIPADVLQLCAGARGGYDTVRPILRLIDAAGLRGPAVIALALELGQWQYVRKGSPGRLNANTRRYARSPQVLAHWIAARTGVEFHRNTIRSALTRLLNAGIVSQLWRLDGQAGAACYFAVHRSPACLEYPHRFDDRGNCINCVTSLRHEEEVTPMGMPVSEWRDLLEGGPDIDDVRTAYSWAARRRPRRAGARSTDVPQFDRQTSAPSPETSAPSPEASAPSLATVAPHMYKNDPIERSNRTEEGEFARARPGELNRDRTTSPLLISPPSRNPEGGNRRRGRRRGEFKSGAAGDGLENSRYRDLFRE